MLPQLQETASFCFIRSVSQSGTRHRAVLRHKVKTFWIDGVLESSLQEMAFIELETMYQPEAVAQPWKNILQPLPSGDEQSRPSTNLRHVLAEMNDALLILGAPGAGKTTQLLYLARELMIQGENDPHSPIPVVFNLSSWDASRQPIELWLLGEFAAKYGVPHTIAQPWLENGDLWLLLDGLDEVSPPNREACVQALNAFYQAYAPRLVVCSRLADYKALTTQLHFPGAILLKPLTPQQINAYLSRREKYHHIYGFLQKDTWLQALAATPLMLRIILWAYQEIKEMPVCETADDYRHRLFDAYIDYMFKRREPTKQYTPHQTRQWLTWLAQKMQQHTQSIFLIEQIQPSWLSSRQQRWLYTLLTRTFSGLLLGFIFGLHRAISNWLKEDTYFNIILWVVGGLLLGLATAVVDGLSFERDLKGIIRRYTTTRWQGIGQALMGCIIFGAGGGLLFSFFFDRAYGWSAGALFGAMYGLLWGLKLKEQTVFRDIQTVEVLSLSATGILKGLLYGTGVGVVIGLVLGWMMGPYMELFVGTQGVLTTGLFMGTGFGLIAVPFGALDYKIAEGKQVAYQGMHLSFRNAILTGVLFGGWGVVIYVFMYGLIIESCLSIGIITGGGAMFWYGLQDIIRHGFLRLLLQINREVPRHYGRFLDYAANRTFLCKVGGGYVFLHPLLLEHFASSGLHEAPVPPPMLDYS